MGSWCSQAGERMLSEDQHPSPGWEKPHARVLWKPISHSSSIAVVPTGWAGWDRSLCHPLPPRSAGTAEMPLGAWCVPV